MTYRVVPYGSYVPVMQIVKSTVRIQSASSIISHGIRSSIVAHPQAKSKIQWNIEIRDTSNES